MIYRILRFVLWYIVPIGIWVISFLIRFVIQRGLSDGNGEASVLLNAVSVVGLLGVPVGYIVLIFLPRVKLAMAVVSLSLLTLLFFVLMFSDYIPYESYASRHKFDIMESDYMKSIYGNYQQIRDSSTKLIRVIPSYDDYYGVEIDVAISGLVSNAGYNRNSKCDPTAMSGVFNCVYDESCSVGLAFDADAKKLEVKDDCFVWGDEVSLSGLYHEITD